MTDRKHARTRAKLTDDRKARATGDLHATDTARARQARAARYWPTWTTERADQPMRATPLYANAATNTLPALDPPAPAPVETLVTLRPHRAAHWRDQLRENARALDSIAQLFPGRHGTIAAAEAKLLHTTAAQLRELARDLTPDA